MILRALAALAIATLAGTPLALADPAPVTGEDAVAVFFPRVKEPYRTAFMQIVDGSREILGARATVQEVDGDYAAADVAAQIAARNARTVMLLGPWGMRVAAELDDTGVDRVVGGVLMQPDRFPSGTRGVSMIPAPLSLFTRLREITPSVRRIWVIHGMDDSEWLIEQAARDAAALGLEFHATQRDSMTEGARAYLDLIARLDSTADALWLPPRSRIVREESVLEAVIATAWRNNFIVFSSDPDLTQRGVMLGALPDYTGMGRALGELARAPSQSEARVELLESLDLTVNLKTANHLGVNVEADDPRFKVIWGR